MKNYYYTYYKNKNYYKLVTYHNGEYDGLYEEYYNFNKYFNMCNYKNHKFSNRQQIKIRCHYKNGKLHGLYEQWFESGLKYKKCYYENGILNGDYEEYHNLTRFFQKSCRIKCYYNYGLRQGICITWDVYGKIFSIKKYNMGSITEEKLFN